MNEIAFVFFRQENKQCPGNQQSDLRQWSHHVITKNVRS